MKHSDRKPWVYNDERHNYFCYDNRPCAAKALGQLKDKAATISLREALSKLIATSPEIEDTIPF